ncbi:toll/interleukin-1 receptor domain-containing protein [Lentzea sp. BCCO 10_0798]|uniref:Toll/interleukin-1 receptor domain-containing protein n=1 Tax=Lentzea kristufekii TaxID=3095430 RepID=A0ABU4TK25_9PSEU|nr:toll/interleukin-1 receptor domain-containing protein [Lentzea sp. BCCO 10_0798]MDX8048620.1 toll/interleukin-1 receptor domain-containing protein [Lentzea sp. BCCO 10_0798]
MPGVFVNYRTGDGEWAAALVKRELSARFGAGQVFYASQSIRLGEDFSREILSGLRRCEVLLALIGPRWVNAVDREGVRRLDKPDDWVRREILEAFDCGLRVIPVLMDGIDPLREADLPDVLQRVARCQYLRIHHRSDDLDLPRLVDELVELVPELVAPRSSSTPRPGRPAEGELRSPITEFRQALSEPLGLSVHERVQAAASAVLELLTESRYPTSGHLDDSELPSALEKRLTAYEHDMAPLLRLVAIGVRSGDRRHDELWTALVERFLRPAPRHRGAQDVWVNASSYPALLLTCVIGVAAVAAGREELLHRLLCRTSATTADGRSTPVLRELALRNVVDPRHAAALPAWGGTPPHQALSVQLRQVLSRVFFNVVDGAAFDWAFADYEFLRSLLELHDAPFSSLGEFAVRLDHDDSVIYQRNAARLDADSALLRAGAFDGDPAQVAAAWRELRQATRARYH